jgi:hypothetical protein
MSITDTEFDISSDSDFGSEITNNSIESEIERLKIHINTLKTQLHYNNRKQILHFKKLLSIIYGYGEMINYIGDIIVYGKTLENILRHKDLNNTKAYIMFPHLDKKYFFQIVERLSEIDYITNNDYNIEKRLFICRNDEVYNIPYWDLQLNINGLILNIILHNKTYTNEVLFTSDNIILTKNGLSIKHFTNYDKKRKNKYASLSLLDNLGGIINNETSMINEPIFSTKIDIFSKIEKQNELIKSNYKIIGGFYVNDNIDENCSICYRKHMEDTSYLYKLKCSHTFCSECLYRSMTNEDLNNCDNCPVCRQNIQLGFISE